jgi:hypothetical protein
MREKEGLLKRIGEGTRRAEDECGQGRLAAGWDRIDEGRVDQLDVKDTRNTKPTRG